MSKQRPRGRAGHSLSFRADTRRVFNAVKARPCKRHGAAPGAPCWLVPKAEPTLRQRAAKAVCGARIRAAGVPDALPPREQKPREQRQ